MLSAELDDQLLNGDWRQNDDLLGVFNRLGTTSLVTPGAAIAAFDDFVAAFVAGIDGLWATESSHVGIVAGVDTYKIAAAAFRDIDTRDLGATAFTDYAMQPLRRILDEQPDARRGVRYPKRHPDPPRTVDDARPDEGRGVPALGISERRRHLHRGTKGRTALRAVSVLVGDVILVQSPPPSGW